MGLFYSVEVTQLLDEGTLKVTALVGMDSRREAELIKPFCHQLTDHGGGMLISCVNGKCISHIPYHFLLIIII